MNALSRDNQPHFQYLRVERCVIIVDNPSQTTSDLGLMNLIGISFIVAYIRAFCILEKIPVNVRPVNSLMLLTLSKHVMKGW